MRINTSTWKLTRKQRATTLFSRASLRLSFLLLLCVLSTTTTSAQNTAETVPPGAATKSIAIVYSYEAEFWVAAAEEKGITAALAEGSFIEGKNLQISRIFMNTKTVNKTAEKMTAITPGIVAQIKKLKPDVIVLFDDDALQCIGPEFLNTPFPVVFGSVNGNPSQTDYSKTGALVASFAQPTYNITGVLEWMPVLSGFEIMKEINPDAKTAIIASDISFVSQAAIDSIGGIPALEKAALAIFPPLFTNDYTIFKEFVMSQQGKVDVLALITPYSMVDAQGNPVPQQQLMRWLMENNTIPEVSYSEILGEEGAMLTIAVDLKQQGFFTGKMCLQVLAGTRPADIPVIDPVSKKLVLNLARAKYLGIKIPLSILKRANVVHTSMSAYPEARKARK